MREARTSINGFLAIVSAVLVVLMVTPVTTANAGGYHHGKHGKGAHGAGHHTAKRLGPHWKETLSDEQRAKLDKLHLDFAREKLPLKANVRRTKVEIALLVTQDKQDKKAIEKQLDAMLQLKRQIKLKKYAYLAATRNILTAEQRVSFDMDVMHRAMHKRKGGGY